MSGFRLTREAARDVTEIFDYIAERDTIEAAERVRVTLLDAMQRLAKMSGMGHKRRNIT